MIGLGRREAKERLAHFFCEMVTRLKAIGRVENLTCEWPYTQTEVGDALGLSTAHVNRTLQELRGANLITLMKGSLTVDDREELKALGEFDPTYLHQQPRDAA
jgi:CRP-like cAMP-binding protein